MKRTTKKASSKKATKKSARKVTKKANKKASRRKNPTATLELLNKYVGKPIIFVYKMPGFDSRDYDTFRKEGILLKPESSNVSGIRCMWRVIFKGDRNPFYIPRTALSRIEIKEQYPYPIFNYKGRPELDYGQNNVYSRMEL